MVRCSGVVHRSGRWHLNVERTQHLPITRKKLRLDTRSAAAPLWHAATVADLHSRTRLQEEIASIYSCDKACSNKEQRNMVMVMVMAIVTVDVNHEGDETVGLFLVVAAVVLR